MYRQGKGTHLGQVITEMICCGFLEGLALFSQERGLAVPDLLKIRAAVTGGKAGVDTTPWKAAWLRGGVRAPGSRCPGWNPYPLLSSSSSASLGLLRCETVLKLAWVCQEKGSPGLCSPVSGQQVDWGIGFFQGEGGESLQIPLCLQPILTTPL